MWNDILRRVPRRAPGAPDEPWARVKAAAAGASAGVPAAVLVPIIARGGAMTVLFTRRTDDLARHAGQVSFPGGRAEAGDAAPVATALREAREEVGIAAASVAVVGRLEERPVGTGYRIVPVVGLLADPPPFAADSREVAEIFEVPLPFVLDPANYRRERMVVEGVPRCFHALSYRRYFIWGATAAILVNLRDVLRAPC